MSPPPRPDPAGSAPDDATLHPQVRLALATWPQIDPAVEGIVTRIADADDLLRGEMKVSLERVGLTMEEFKVLMTLLDGPCSHGALCRALDVSTGAMTNRLDKLEGAGLVARARDPQDRRGVTLSLTAAGRERLDAYVELGADRERELLGGLTKGEKAQLGGLLDKLLAALQAELGPAPTR